MFISRVIRPGPLLISPHLDDTPGNLVTPGLEADLHEPPEPRGVVVADGLSVAERLEDGVGFQDLLLDPGGDVGGYAGIIMVCYRRIK